MILKKLFSLIVVGCFVAAMFVSTSQAADITTSASIFSGILSTSNPNPAGGSWSYPYGKTAGSDDSYSHLESWFYEAEMKFKSKGETANGWKTYAELEFELGQGGKNDFELEEASANVDFGGFMLSVGILEDWSQDTGAVYNWGISELDTKFDDESPALRLSLTGNKQLHVDLKLQFAQATDKDSSGATAIDVKRDETRVQAKYNFGMGWVQLIYGSEADVVVNSDVGGDYAYSATKTNVMVKVRFGQIQPFLSISNLNSKQTAEAAGSAEEDNKMTQTLLGADYFLSATSRITANYMTQSLDFGGSDPLVATITGLGASFSFKPVTFVVTYANFANNYSEIDTTGADFKQNTIAAAMSYSF
jgi:hypothetical protein